MGNLENLQAMSVCTDSTDSVGAGTSSLPDLTQKGLTPGNYLTSFASFKFLGLFSGWVAILVCQGLSRCNGRSSPQLREYSVT